MKYTRVAIIWFVCLPVLTIGYSQNRNSLNQVESDEKSKLLNLRCEYYNSTCVVEAKAKGSDASHCKGTQQCPTKSCYVVWKLMMHPNA